MSDQFEVRITEDENSEEYKLILNEARVLLSRFVED